MLEQELFDLLSRTSDAAFALTDFDLLVERRRMTVEVTVERDSPTFDLFTHGDSKPSGGFWRGTRYPQI